MLRSADQSRMNHRRPHARDEANTDFVNVFKGLYACSVSFALVFTNKIVD
jgi:hypothetical protein